MTDEELDSLQSMITFFLSNTKDYWDNHPEEVFSIITDLAAILDNLN